MQNMIQPQPPGFRNHVFKKSFLVSQNQLKVWQWLNTPETFTKGQIPPFRVEFYSPDPDAIPNGFHAGVLNVHHGPLMNFAGVLTKIEAPNYRDLQYFYGSYAITMRWIRPYRLEFWLEKQPGGTEVTVAISSYVKPWVYGIWDSAQKLFWRSFKTWVSKTVKKL